MTAQEISSGFYVDGTTIQVTAGNVLVATIAGDVTSVTDNGGGTLTISPNSGAVLAGINLSNHNTWIGAQTFYSSGLLINNPANTFAYTFVGAAITAARHITLPLLTTGDTLVTAAFTQTLTNKTLTAPVITVLQNNTAQTTLSGFTAGSVIYSEPEQGSAIKVFVGQATGYENSGIIADTITFPTAFTNTPIILGNDTGMDLTSGGANAGSVNTTTLTFPINMSATASGNIVIMGY